MPHAPRGASIRLVDMRGGVAVVMVPDAADLSIHAKIATGKSGRLGVAASGKEICT